MADDYMMVGHGVERELVRDRWYLPTYNGSYCYVLALIGNGLRWT